MGHQYIHVKGSDLYIYASFLWDYAVLPWEMHILGKKQHGPGYTSLNAQSHFRLFNDM